MAKYSIHCASVGQLAGYVCWQFILYGKQLFVDGNVSFEDRVVMICICVSLANDKV